VRTGYILASLVLAILFVGVSWSADLQKDGLQALDHQDYAQAQQIFSQLAAADPKDYSAFFNLALAESALQRNADAIGHYKQVLALKPGLYEAQLNLGILELRSHDEADAVTQLQAAARQKPTVARPQRYLGEALLDRMDYPGAQAAFATALKLDPKIAVAELGLGRALLHQNKLDEALPYYKQAVALDPALKSYLLEIAMAFSESKQQGKAADLLSQFPDDAGAREALGNLYLQTNRPGDAVTQFEAAVKISPTSGNQVALATAYLQNSQPSLAQPLLERALAANPNDFDLRMVVGRLHRDRREFPLAAQFFVSAAALKPDSVKAWNEAASAFVMAKQYPEALAALDKVRALNAESAGDVFYRALVLDTLHQVKPALASYQRFLQMADGKFPDQEFQARQRSRILEKEANR
jgi:tetratricopeptide (TPR) repeat protein